MGYIITVLEVIKSPEFTAWMAKLKDRVAAMSIAARIRRATLGSLGDHKFLRDGVSEMRVDVGAGYRMYFTRKGATVVLLLCGGDKRSQDADIQRAIELARVWKD